MSLWLSSLAKQGTLIQTCVHLFPLLSSFQNLSTGNIQVFFLNPTEHCCPLNVSFIIYFLLYVLASMARHIFSHISCSSNFILPIDLLEFSRRIEAHHPHHRFTLDLRFNPLNRDPVVKGQALRILHPFCEVLTDDCDFRSGMVEHVSVM